MSRKWTTKEKDKIKKELENLYIVQNKTISEIGKILNISEKTVFSRMKRLGIPSNPQNKDNFCNRNTKVVIPRRYSSDLAEFVGILLGDGHLSSYQTQITVADIDGNYLNHVINLIRKLFGAKARYCHRLSHSVKIIYIGYTELVDYFKNMGLVSNKVKEQVDVPKWIFNDTNYKKSFLRGFFDTDGSVYKLKFGVQMSFCNRSLPLLYSTRKILLDLGFHPSKISGYNIYLTRRLDLNKYASEIGFNNPKHHKRALRFGIEV